MKPEDRLRTILAYLATNEVAGTPNILHHQLKLYRDVDWSVYTTRRRLKDLRAVGYVEYLPDVAKGYYTISDQGRAAFTAGITDEDLEAILGSGDYDTNQ